MFPKVFLKSKHIFVHNFSKINNKKILLEQNKFLQINKHYIKHEKSKTFTKTQIEQSP